MDARGPLELPDLRMWLLNQWKAPHGEFYKIATDMIADGVEYDEHGAPIITFDPRIDHHALTHAELWWVSPDMSRLVDAASKTLLPTTLTPELLPCHYGMAVFAEPLLGTAGDTGDQLRVRVLLWGIGRAMGTGLPAVGISSYLLHDFDGHGEEVVPAGRTEWTMGHDTDAVSGRVFADDQGRLDSMSEDRRYVASLWLLASQPLSESSTVQVTNKAKARRLKKAGGLKDVRVVNLRERPRVHSPGDGQREVNWSHRWIVGGEEGGFWRQQACGPGRSQRRPLWIMPYIKGPEDKPLKVRETVKVLREER